VQVTVKLRMEAPPHLIKCKYNLYSKYEQVWRMLYYVKVKVWYHRVHTVAVVTFWRTFHRSIYCREIKAYECIEKFT